MHRGSIAVNQPVTLMHRDGGSTKARIKELYVFEGLGKIKTEEVVAGDICAVVGVEGFEIETPLPTEKLLKPCLPSALTSQP